MMVGMHAMPIAERSEETPDPLGGGRTLHERVSGGGP